MAERNPLGEDGHPAPLPEETDVTDPGFHIDDWINENGLWPGEMSQ